MKTKNNDELEIRLAPFYKLDQERLALNNPEILHSDIEAYNTHFLKTLNSIYDHFKFNDSFVHGSFLYLIYGYNSPEKLSHDEIIKACENGSNYVYQNKILLKGQNNINSILPSQAFKDSCQVFNKLLKMGY